MNGKGSKRRPQFVSNDKFSINWDRAFGKEIQDCDHNLVEHPEFPGQVICTKCERTFSNR